MRGISWFRRRRPVPPPTDLQILNDVPTLSAWGLSLLAWRDMTDQDRAWYRDNITKALTHETERAI